MTALYEEVDDQANRGAVCARYCAGVPTGILASSSLEVDVQGLEQGGLPLQVLALMGALAEVASAADKINRTRIGGGASRITSHQWRVLDSRLLALADISETDIRADAEEGNDG